jgi:3,4-dihydroxy 2-butanone 4-phosphate synthase / GTP cyclohydrolase II
MTQSHHKPSDLKNSPRLEEILQGDVQGMRNCPQDLQCADCKERLCVKLVAVADFPTDYGSFRILGFVNNKDGKDHTIILKGEIGDGENLLCRIHSACLTGDAFGSRRCDCGDQLHAALQAIEKEGRGLLLYQQAEGRGIGLTNKIRAYVLQDKGQDTMEANQSLGFLPDERDYVVPVEMLKKIGVKSVRLLTNNPEKVSELNTMGIRIVERVPLQPSTHKDNERYLKTKKDRFGHWLYFSVS